MKRKSILLVFLTLLLSALFATVSLAAATFSDAWKQDASGNWYVQKPDGSRVVNAWLCDDAVVSNGKAVWYLLDKSGNMVSSPLVHDKTGNYYSLETEHNGYFGMLRYKSGVYGGVNLALESQHNGSFAAILNQDAISALKAAYGVMELDIDNSNIVYTSSFAARKTASIGGGGGGSSSGGGGGGGGSYSGGSSGGGSSTGGGSSSGGSSSDGGSTSDGGSSQGGGSSDGGKKEYALGDVGAIADFASNSSLKDIDAFVDSIGEPTDAQKQKVVSDLNAFLDKEKKTGTLDSYSWADDDKTVICQFSSGYTVVYDLWNSFGSEVNDVSAFEYSNEITESAVAAEAEEDVFSAAVTEEPADEAVFADTDILAASSAKDIKSLVITSFLVDGFENGRDTDLNALITTLSKHTECKVLNASIDDYKKMAGYDLIIINTHGGNFNGLQVLGTSDRCNILTNPSVIRGRAEDFHDGSLLLYSRRLWSIDLEVLVSAKYFDKYYKDGDFDNSIVLMTACHSAENFGSELALFSQFCDKGAICTLGFNNSVLYLYGDALISGMTDRLISGDPIYLSYSKTVSKIGYTDTEYFISLLKYKSPEFCKKYTDKELEIITGAYRNGTLKNDFTALPDDEIRSVINRGTTDVPSNASLCGTSFMNLGRLVKKEDQLPSGTVSIRGTFFNYDIESDPDAPECYGAHSWHIRLSDPYGQISVVSMSITGDLLKSLEEMNWEEEEEFFNELQKGERTFTGDFRVIDRLDENNIETTTISNTGETIKNYYPYGPFVFRVSSVE